MVSEIFSDANDPCVPGTQEGQQFVAGDSISVHVVPDEDTDVLIIRMNSAWVDYQSFTVEPHRLHKRFVELVKTLDQDRSLLDPLLDLEKKSLD